MNKKTELNNRSSGKFIISRLMQKLDGIGISKSASRAASTVKGQNGHKISTQAHSIKSIQNARTVVTQYISYLQENYGKKIYPHINSDTAREFLISKIDHISGGTLNTYISTMAKISDGFNGLGIKNIDRARITDLRSELKNEGVNLKKNYHNRSYPKKEIENIREYMQATPYLLSFDLQVEAGLRADDALNSSKWIIHSNNTITVEGSKNGLSYTTRVLPSNLVNRATEAKKSGFKANYSDYRTQLKQAGADDGSHGLRYSFAQNRYEELKQEGYTNLEARAQVSIEMGHSRDEITLHYLKS
ncbi:integrase domain-containing protein [Campylobacter sp. CCUG 57310]|uniref:integrase domain-containing protein n=1 Tax=Campylobacter sp. CCUG 57310 TaxID=2517362 RepID=UPI0015633993|nr:integrase domain-containing protein [Campylobacter sp. CCUG 57310]QKF93246.1 integrase [Campylobacter sp. CCUG 57310]